MEINREKIVEFDKHCKNCVYKDLPETKDPCYECLTEPVNVYSHRPIKFKERITK